MEEINYSKLETDIKGLTVQLENPSRADWFTGVCDVHISGKWLSSVSSDKC